MKKICVLIACAIPMALLCACAMPEGLEPNPETVWDGTYLSERFDMISFYQTNEQVEAGTFDLMVEASEVNTWLEGTVDAEDPYTGYYAGEDGLQVTFHLDGEELTVEQVGTDTNFPADLSGHYTNAHSEEEE